MNSNQVKKWVAFGFIYLAVVIGGYLLFQAIIGASPNHSQEGINHHQNETKDFVGHDDQNNHNGHEDYNDQNNHNGHEDYNDQNNHIGHEDYNDHNNHNDLNRAEEQSEVVPVLAYENGTISVYFEAEKGERVTELQKTHERFVHLIIVSADLEEYIHLHPEQTSDGVFEASFNLTEGAYFVIADIKPVGYTYHPHPVPLHIGHDHHQVKPQLVPDDTWTQTLNEITVTLHAENLAAGKSAVLHYNVEGGIVEPYLGALGHVVILDEEIQEFIHVHPVSLDETVFEAYFNNTGLYRIWAEFKVNGDVLVFPFTVKVQ